MQNEHLEHLLQLTDAAIPGPKLGSSMIAAAETRLRRRRRRRAASAMVTVVLLASVGIFVFHEPQASPVAIAQQTPGDDAAIEAEIREHTQVAQLLISDQRLELAQEKLDRLSNAPGSAIWLQNQREQAATNLLHGAALSTNKDDAAVVCREVVALFPDAGAASVANGRLAELR